MTTDLISATVFLCIMTVSSSFTLQDNTTWHLVEDLEALRVHLQVEKWVVFGGSWGSTLALAYAIKYPNCCRALIIRGIFTVRRWVCLVSHDTSM